MGLARAGFAVVGVDIVPQPNYPFDFIEADALEFPMTGVDFVWASPPCQRYMQSGMVNKREAPDLVGAVRDRLESAGCRWVIENVPGAPLRRNLVLCGSMFGLGVRRHRIFEMHPWISILVPPCDHSKPITGVYGHPHGKGGAWRNGNKPMLPSTLSVWSRSMGIDWMTARELSQSIPPAYSEFIGKQVLSSAGIGNHPITLPEAMRSDDRPGVPADFETAGAGRK